MRQLSLHSSALTDSEYSTFTSAFSDLALSDDYEHTSLTIREVRAWLKGRYQTLESGTIDNILQLFSPSLGPTDTVTGSEFFAIMRLVSHASHGKQVDRSLVFVQTSAPASPTPTQESHNPFLNLRHTSKPKPDDILSPRHNPPLPPRALSKPIPPPPPRPNFPPPPPKHTPSPLIQQSLVAQKTAHSLKKADEMLGKERILQVLKRSSMPTAPAPAGQQRQPPIPPKRNRSTSPSKSSVSSSSGTGPPPLPRRRFDTMSAGSSSRPADSPPLSATSFQEVALAGTNSDPTPSPIPHRKPTNPFPRRSSSAALGNRTASPSPTRRAPPPVHPDHRPTPPRKPSSVPSSVSSYDHRKKMSGSVYSRGSDDVFSSEEEEAFDVIETPPSATADDGTITRKTRTMTISPFADTDTPPHVPKRNSETSLNPWISSPSRNLFDTLKPPSTSSSSPFDNADSDIQPTSGASLSRSKTSPTTSPNSLANQAHRRRVSLHHALPPSSRAATTIQRTIDKLESSIQPIRYKAEAGIMPKRGFIPSHGNYTGEDGKGLFREERGRDGGVSVDRSIDDEEGDTFKQGPWNERREESGWRPL